MFIDGEIVLKIPASLTKGPPGIMSFLYYKVHSFCIEYFLSKQKSVFHLRHRWKLMIVSNF